MKSASFTLRASIACNSSGRLAAGWRWPSCADAMGRHVDEPELLLPASDTDCKSRCLWKAARGLPIANVRRQEKQTPWRLKTDPFENAAICDQLETRLDQAGRAELNLREALTMLCTAKVARKDQRRIQMGMSIIKLPSVRTLEGFEYNAQPSVDPKQVRELATSHWVANGDSVATGRGQDAPDGGAGQGGHGARIQHHRIGTRTISGPNAGGLAVPCALQPRCADAGCATRPALDVERLTRRRDDPPIQKPTDSVSYQIHSVRRGSKSMLFPTSRSYWQL